MKTYSQSLRESMSGDEIASAQSDHYSMDDYFRRNMGKLSIENKRKLAEFMHELIARGS